MDSSSSVLPSVLQGKSKADKMLFSKGKKEKVITDTLAKKDKLDKMMEMDKDEKMKTKKGKKIKDPTAKTRAARAGLVFPVARLHTKLKALVPANSRVGGTAAVFMAAVLEYLVAELCELAGNKAKQNTSKEKVTDEGGRQRRARINPRYIQFAINEDHEFAELLSRVTLSGGGVVPLSDKKLQEQTTAAGKKKQAAALIDDAELREDDMM